jgi:putative cell wall-binding protein
MTGGTTKSVLRALAGAAVCLTLVAAPAVGIAQAAPVPTTAAPAASGPFTGGFLDSEHGEYLGLGQQYVLPTVTANGTDADFTMSNGTDSFRIQFLPPAGTARLVPGTYENVERIGTSSAGAHIDLGGDGRGCNALSGRVIVDDASYDASGHPLDFSARFEIRCAANSVGLTYPGLFGFVSYNSTAQERTRTISANQLQLEGSPSLTVQQSLTIANNGPAVDTPTGFAISGTDASYFSVVKTTCTTALPAGSSCTVTVSYTEAVINQTATAVLSFTDELASTGPPNAPLGVGTGRRILLNGLPGLATIAGVVTGPDGAGVANVCVDPIDPETAALNGQIGHTGADGSYVTNALQPGTYYLYFYAGISCNGGSLSPYAPQIYGSTTDASGAKAVVVVGGQETTVNVRLVVGGSITGRVTTAAGTPIEDALVTPTGVGDMPYIGGTEVTDANGVFALPSLETGSYSVKYVYWPTFTIEQWQWFNGAILQTNATPVHVTAGQTTGSINAVFPSTAGCIGGCIGSGGTGGGGTGGGGTGGGGSSGATTGGAGGTAPAAVIGRFAGADRYATAVAVSQAEFPTARSAGGVVLARGDGYADALVAAPLAKVEHAPLLLTTGATLPSSTAAELKRVLPSGGKVFLLGGPAAIPDSVATELTNLGYQVDRTGGADRYATAVAVADAVGDPSEVLLATGNDFPDALAAGPAAAHVGGVVLLTDSGQLSPETAAYLSAHAKTVYAVGGLAAESDVKALALVGADRYGTAAMVATTFFTATTSAGIATGLAFPDALSGGALLANIDAPLLLAAPTSLPGPTSVFLTNSKATIDAVDLMGGLTALSAGVASAVTSALQ